MYLKCCNWYYYYWMWLHGASQKSSYSIKNSSDQSLGTNSDLQKTDPSSVSLALKPPSGRAESTLKPPLGRTVMSDADDSNKAKIKLFFWDKGYGNP
ncbi:hypothetical protein L6452_00622 [Arctium lappa]|uniref:Uncharacterized protein n=1 Tax=Arctium lappa TaxID=4217 RepID=A0ACB9FF87_ARCLA|nr:hypothetical protein L6452_00622 [Arctium lappa]